MCTLVAAEKAVMMWMMKLRLEDADCFAAVNDDDVDAGDETTVVTIMDMTGIDNDADECYNGADYNVSVEDENPCSD